MNQYIEELVSHLKPLEAAERDEVINFYQEYLEDGGFTSYDACVTELGTSKQLARKILADYSIKNLSEPESKTSSRSASKMPQAQVRTIWLIILALLSTPITIPLAMGVIGILFGVIVTVLAILFAIVVVFIAAVVVTVVAVFVGVTLLTSSFWTAIFYLGVGIATIGLFLIGLPILIWIIKGLIRGTLNVSTWLYGKITHKNKAEERGAR